MLVRYALGLVILPLTVGVAPAHQGNVLPGNAVVLQITTPSGRVFTATVLEGNRITVGQQNGRTLGLTPRQTAPSALELVVSVREPESTDASDTWPVVARLSAQLNDPVRFDDAFFPIGVQWTGSQSAVGFPQAVTSEPCQRCCVVCGGEVVCACRVKSSCGDCCCPDTCPCEIGG